MCCIFCTVYRKSWYNPCDCSHVALFNYMTVLGLFINMIYLCLNMNVYTRYSSLIEIHHVQSMSQSFIRYMYIFFCIVWFVLYFLVDVQYVCTHNIIFSYVYWWCVNTWQFSLIRETTFCLISSHMLWSVDEAWHFYQSMLLCLFKVHLTIANHKMLLMDTLTWML